MAPLAWEDRMRVLYLLHNVIYISGRYMRTWPTRMWMEKELNILPHSVKVNVHPRIAIDISAKLKDNYIM